MKGRVLIIAGSDPSGGAGVQADIKTVTALGGYAAAAITALTVQNTAGVYAVRQLPPDFIAAQAKAVIDDIGVDAVKIGMIGEGEAGRALARLLRASCTGAPIVLDPVLAASSGGALAAPDVKAALLEELAPLCLLITPNLDEAAALCGFAVDDEATQTRAGERLLATGCRAVLVKGGHAAGGTVSDVLVTREGARAIRHPRIETRAGHGTGCTLASAIATFLAQGRALDAAVDAAVLYVRAALSAAPALGAGAWPLNHGWAIKPD